MINKGFTLQQLLSSDQTLILDGGLATELERKGCDINSALWSAEVLINNPNLITEVHLDYFRAGADIAITASYQGSVAGLLKHRPDLGEASARKLVRDGVDLAIAARKIVSEDLPGRNLFVAGSVGPYGAYLADGSEYRGDYSLSEEAMMEFHQPRIEELVAAGVDILAFETIPSFEETTALLQVLEQFPSMNCWFAFTLADENHISDGTSLKQVVDAIQTSSQVLAIGVNCVSQVIAGKALSTLRAQTDKPLVVYPNSGEVYDAVTKTWSGDHAEGLSLEQQALQWQKNGARLVGGCCRTTPRDIATIRSALR